MKLEKKYPVDIDFMLGSALDKDNKYYLLNSNEFNNNEYPVLDIGQIAVDYFNMDLHKWASIINDSEGNDFTEFLVNIIKGSLKEYNYVLSVLLCNELILLTNELLDSKDYTTFYENKFHEIPGFYDTYLKHYGSIPNESSNIEEILTSLISYIGTYKNLYKVFIKDFFENKQEAVGIINELFPKSMELKYTIIPNIDVKSNTYCFQEIFKITTLNDFMKYDILKIIERRMNINVCKNCGKYFIPRNKSNEKYCDNIFENGKTCKELSYQLKLNNNEVERIYRNSYKTQNAKKQRNSHIKNIEDKFKNWSIMAKEQKDLCKNGSITIEEFKKWLEDNADWHKK